MSLARFWLSRLLLLTVVLLSFTSLSADQVTLQWDANSESNLAGYKLHYGAASRTYETTVDVGNVIQYTLEIPNETYVAATAYNDEGLESGYSNEVFYEAETEIYPATNGQLYYEEISLMAWAFSDQGNGTAYTDGSIAAAAVDVSAGDLIVVIISVVADTTWCTGVTDTQGNIYTVRSAIISGNAANVVMAYCINAEANANNVITATFNNADGQRKVIIAAVFTPDSGETVTLDVAMSGLSAWGESPWQTGTDDTTGDDEVCVVGVQSSNGSTTYSSHEIPGGTAATALTDPAQGMDGWYRILSAIANSLYAEVDPSGSAGYAMEMLCFKSVAAGGETINLSASISAASNTPNAAMNVARALSAVVSASTTTPQCALNVARDLAANIQANSTTPDIVLANLIELVATIAVSSQSSAISLPVARDLAASISAATVTSAIELVIEGLINLATSINAISQTSQPQMAVARELSTQVQTQSTSSALILAVLRDLSGAVAAQSQTPDINLPVLREISTSMAGQTSTSDAALNIVRAISAQISAGTDTSAAVLAVLREMQASMDAATLTSAINLITGGLGVITDAIIESLTTDRTFESLTPNRAMDSLSIERTIEQI